MIVVAPKPRTYPYFQSASGVIHDLHAGVAPVRYLTTIPPNARRCRVCKPR